MRQRLPASCRRGLFANSASQSLTSCCCGSFHAFFSAKVLNPPAVSEAEQLHTGECPQHGSGPCSHGPQPLQPPSTHTDTMVYQGTSTSGLSTLLLPGTGLDMERCPRRGGGLWSGYMGQEVPAAAPGHDAVQDTLASVPEVAQAADRLFWVKQLRWVRTALVCAFTGRNRC